jgi:hypothetical protein
MLFTLPVPIILEGADKLMAGISITGLPCPPSPRGNPAGPTQGSQDVEMQGLENSALNAPLPESDSDLMDTDAGQDAVPQQNIPDTDHVMHESEKEGSESEGHESDLGNQGPHTERQ